METALRALLTGYAPLTALVGTCIVWNHIPQDMTDPSVSLYRISGAPAYSNAGPDSLTSSVVQIDVRAASVNSMWAIRDAILARLSGYRIAPFGGIFLRSERQSMDKPQNILFHRSSMDFDVWHTAT